MGSTQGNSALFGQLRPELCELGVQLLAGCLDLAVLGQSSRPLRLVALQLPLHLQPTSTCSCFQEILTIAWSDFEERVSHNVWVD